MQKQDNKIEVEKSSYSQSDWDFSRITNFAQLGKIPFRNLAVNDKTLTFTKYTKAQLVEYLKAPDKNEKQLRDMSTYLYNISNFYRNLILYFSRMLTFAYIVEPYNLDLTKKVNEKTFRTQYQKVLNDLDKMNIKHEFQKIITIAFKQDVFYGYIYETADSFMVQELDPNYCKIASGEDGVYNIAFNCSYWDSRKEDLELVDPEFKTLYNTYKSQGNKLKWQELNSEKTICIKINEEVLYPIPPFVSLFSALADIEDYRALSKASTETNNYKALSLKIPINKDTGEPLIDWDKAKEYYGQLANVLPENIGAILTPMDIDAWDFQKSGALSDTNLVSNAEATFFAESGVNNQLLGGHTSSSSSLEKSMEVDETKLWGVLRQFERWTNRRLKRISGSVKFRANFLNVTTYNQKEVHERYLKDGQYGLPVRMAIAATSDMTASSLTNMAYLENTILKLADNEIPLISSNVQSGDSGRPTNKSNGEELDDAGEKTKEQK